MLHFQPNSCFAILSFKMFKFWIISLSEAGSGLKVEQMNFRIILGFSLNTKYWFFWKFESLHLTFANIFWQIRYFYWTSPKILCEIILYHLKNCEKNSAKNASTHIEKWTQSMACSKIAGFSAMVSSISFTVSVKAIVIWVFLLFI